MSHYSVLSKNGNCRRLLKFKSKLKIGCFYKKSRERILDILWAFIPLALVGYEMIIANSGLRASLANYHLISNAHSWNHC